MRDDALAVDCPAREPDPVLLEQLTALAVASVAPTVKPWWQRFTVKTGAAAVAGVLVISAATADAEHARPKSTLVVTAPAPSHVAPHHKSARAASVINASSPSLPVWSPRGVSMRHADSRMHRHEHSHGKMNREGNGNGGGSQNDQVTALVARLATSLQAVATQDDNHGHGHAHAHRGHEAHSRH